MHVDFSAQAYSSIFFLRLDGTSVFTKRLYPKVLKQTGIHFFNIPCQTTTWYPSLTCPQINDPDRCSPRPCSARERLINELKCSLPICPNQPICIPVYYQPEDLQPSVGDLIVETFSNLAIAF